MVKFQYYGVYNSALTTQSGCNQQVMSAGSTAAVFPSSIVFSCPRCNKEHTFIYARHIATSSKSQQKNIYNWAKLNSIITDVVLPQV